MLKTVITLAAGLALTVSVACTGLEPQKMDVDVAITLATPEPTAAPTVALACSADAVRIKFLEEKTVDLQKRLNAGNRELGPKVAQQNRRIAHANFCIRKLLRDEPAVECAGEYAVKYGLQP